MAEVADLCIGEFTKLGAKIRAVNPFLLTSCKRDGADQAEEIKQHKKDSSSSSSSSSSSRAQKTMSETTVFLLMDRFAPN